jgi:hypothetical protein
MPATFSVPPRAPFDQRIGEMQRLIALDESADPLGATDLVRGERHKISPEVVDIAYNAAGALDRIDMHEGARSMGQRGRPRNRLNNSGLIIGEHDGDQRPLALLAAQPRQNRSESQKVQTAVNRDRHHFDGIAPEPPSRQH